jgi:hypothetical protein
MLCSLTEVDWHFRCVYCLYLQGHDCPDDGTQHSFVSIPSSHPLILSFCLVQKAPNSVRLPFKPSLASLCTIFPVLPVSSQQRKRRRQHIILCQHGARFWGSKSTQHQHLETDELPVLFPLSPCSHSRCLSLCSPSLTWTSATCNGAT